MKRVLSWTTALAMLVAAWFVSGATPDGEQRIDDPFPVTAREGQPTTSDNLGVLVHDVHLSDRISTGGWYSEGTWLVVSLDAWLVHREPASLKLGYLIVGDRAFLASERVANYDLDASLGGLGLHTGIPRTGTLVFELPGDIASDPDAADASLQLSLGTPLPALSPTQNQRGTAVVELDVDLTALPHETATTLPDTSWTTP